MKLSVIILNYNVRHFLELCLKSVERAVSSIDAEIIVVDNNSPDDSCVMVKSLFPSVKLIENRENSGFSKGNNIGVKVAKGEYLCILNPDTVVAEDTFTQLLTFSDSKKNMGIVGCQLIDGKGTYLPESKRNIPLPLVSLKKLVGIDKDYYANDVEKASTGKVDILVGAFMFVKKEVYDAVGGFDEDYFMYGEDIDLSYKVLKANYSNYYYGKTTVIHFKGESTLKDANYAKRFYGAMQIFYKKHFKSNLFFNAAVSVGIALARGIKKPKSVDIIKPQRSYAFNAIIEKSLNKVLPKPLQIVSFPMSTIQANSMIVYDINTLNIKKVIEDMKDKSAYEDIVFRFIPKNSKFIIGSDSAVSRGDVIHF